MSAMFSANDWRLVTSVLIDIRMLAHYLEEGKAMLRTTLRALMKERGLSVRKLAQAARVSPATVQNILNGTNTGRLSTVVALSDAIGVPQEVLVREWEVEKDAPARALLTSSDTGVSITNTGDGAVVASPGALHLGMVVDTVEKLNLRKRLENARKEGAPNTWGMPPTASDAVIADSDAMAPTLRDGDELLIGPAEEARSGDIVIGAREDGSSALVRLVRDGDTLWGTVENPDWPGERQFRLASVAHKVLGFKRMF